MRHLPFALVIAACVGISLAYPRLGRLALLFAAIAGLAWFFVTVWNATRRQGQGDTGGGADYSLADSGGASSGATHSHASSCASDTSSSSCGDGGGDGGGGGSGGE